MLNVSSAVSGILKRVKRDGDRALLFYGRKFDKTSDKKISYGEGDMSRAWHSIPDGTRSLFKKISDRIGRYHSSLKKKYIREELLSPIPGLGIRFRFVPLENVGIYVPGGNYPYPSTVFMTAVPARIAGIKEIRVATPPHNLNQEILAACHV
ncbi:MAG TPA: histidinol dehydrogenase, partial [bacterium]|nr:histidinol dehydrogenase [bacterium]